MINLINRCVPETPSFLLYTHQEEKAERALQWLRGEEADVSAEMATIHGNIRRMREQGAAVPPGITGLRARVLNQTLRVVRLARAFLLSTF